jgi:hypothetical protein
MRLRYDQVMERLRARAIAAFLLAAAAAVTAGNALASPPDRRCACRNRDGLKYELGQTACIRVGGMSYLARCEMNLNVMTWKKLHDGCPTARLDATGNAQLD